MKIVDMHADTISTLMNSDQHLFSNKRMIDIEKLIKGDYLLQCFAMFIVYENKIIKDYNVFDYCNQMINKYYEEINSLSNYIKPIYTYHDIEDNIKNNIISSMLTIEEGGVLQGKLENLDHFYNQGVRLITLTWNYKNEIACPNIDYFNFDFNNPVFKVNDMQGLTKFGINVVKRMNELGMIIDCSHASDKTFFDVIKYSEKPIVCSHSCSRSVCNHVRNMSDDMLLKLKENRGVVGINYCHDFIKEDDSIATVKDIVKHINYIRDLIGVEYIGLGSDFDGISNKNLQLKDASMMPLLLDELVSQNYSINDIDLITHQNVLRVFKENLK